MRRKLSQLANQYEAALHSCLSNGPRVNAKKARALGREAVALGADTLDLARIHERALITFSTPESKAAQQALISRATAFFSEALAPVEEQPGGMREVRDRLKDLNKQMREQGANLADAKRKLKQEVLERKRVEAALKKSDKSYALLLRQSKDLQEQLRDLSRRLLIEREEERKMLSRELHDEVAQTLSGINAQLATLRRDAGVHGKKLVKDIAAAQKMIENSVDVVHRFAHSLRPPELDDLGLIPAIHAFAKLFLKRTGIRVRITASAEVETLSIEKRTVIYRVAQEALTNISRHANASFVNMSIRKMTGAFLLKIKDDGKAFEVREILRAKGSKQLGLLGMRERVEMVGGTFGISSEPGKGTKIKAIIPIDQARTEKVKKRRAKKRVAGRKGKT